MTQPRRHEADACVHTYMIKVKGWGWSTGFPEYGVSVNPAKTRVSFELRASGEVLRRNTVRGADGQEFMPWCGLLVNTATLDLQADYTRYAGAHLASSLTIPLTKVSHRTKGASLIE